MSDQLQEILIRKIDDVANEQQRQRDEARAEHKEIKSQISNITERMIHVEWKLKLQQTGLYALSAAIGAALWKVPTLISWIKEHIP